MDADQNKDIKQGIIMKSCKRKLTNISNEIIKNIDNNTKLVIIGPPQSGKKTFVLMLKEIITDKLGKAGKKFEEIENLLKKVEVKLIIPGLTDENFIQINEFGKFNNNYVKTDEEIKNSGIKEKFIEILSRLKHKIDYDLGSKKEFIYITCKENGCIPNELLDVIECDPKNKWDPEKILPISWRIKGANILEDIEDRNFQYFIPSELEEFTRYSGKDSSEKKNIISKLNKHRESSNVIVNDLGLGNFLVLDVIVSTDFPELIRDYADKFFDKLQVLGNALFKVVATQTFAAILLVSFSVVVEEKKSFKQQFQLIELSKNWNKSPEDRRYIIASALVARIGGGRNDRDELKDALDKLFGASNKQIKEISNELNNIKVEIDKLKKEIEELKCIQKLGQFGSLLSSENITIDSTEGIINENGNKRPLVTDGMENLKNDIIRELKEGNKVLITGPKGSGKSTLAEWIIADFLDEIKKEWGNTYIFTPHNNIDDSDIAKLMNYDCNLMIYYDPPITGIYSSFRYIDTSNINLKDIPLITNKIERINGIRQIPTLLVLSEGDQVDIKENKAYVKGGRELKDYNIKKIYNEKLEFNKKIYLSIANNDSCWDAIKDNVKLPIQAKLLGNVFNSLKIDGKCDKLKRISSNSIYIGYVIYSLIGLADDESKMNNYRIKRWFLTAYLHRVLIKDEPLSADLFDSVNRTFFNIEDVNRQYYEIMSVRQHDLIENAVSEVVDGIIKAAKGIEYNNENENVKKFINSMGMSLTNLKSDKIYNGSKNKVKLSDILKWIIDDTSSKLYSKYEIDIATIIMSVIEDKCDVHFFKSDLNDPCNTLNSNHIGIRLLSWELCKDIRVMTEQKNEFLELLKDNDKELRYDAWNYMYSLIDKGIITKDNKKYLLQLLNDINIEIKSYAWYNVSTLLDKGIITKEDARQHLNYFLELLKDNDELIKSYAHDDAQLFIEKGIITKDQLEKYL